MDTLDRLFKHIDEIRSNSTTPIPLALTLVKAASRIISGISPLTDTSGIPLQYTDRLIYISIKATDSTGNIIYPYPMDPAKDIDAIEYRCPLAHSNFLSPLDRVVEKIDIIKGMIDQLCNSYKPHYTIPQEELEELLCELEIIETLWSKEYNFEFQKQDGQWTKEGVFFPY